MVPATSKKYFPQMALGFDDPRVKVHITDGIKFVQEAAEGTYDAIIVDSSDPVGPAEVLFQKASLSLLTNTLHASFAPWHKHVPMPCHLVSDRAVRDAAVL